LWSYVTFANSFVPTTVISYVIHRIIYDMCVQRSDYSQQLYEKYRKVIEDYTIQTVSTKTFHLG